MAFTENYAILNDFPLFWDEALLAKNIHAPRFHRDMPSRFAVIPRRGGTEQIRWFEAEPTYVLHFVNAYEDGDEIILDGFFQGDPEPGDVPGGDKWDRAFRFLALDRLQTRLHRWRLNLQHRPGEGAAAHRHHHRVRHAERALRRPGYRYAYAATGKPGWFLFDGLVRHDLKDGTEERYTLRRRRVRQRDRHGAAGRQRRRGRRLPGHAHHRHDRGRLLLPGLRRGPGRRRARLPAAAARARLQRHPLDVGAGRGAPPLAHRRERRRRRSACERGVRGTGRSSRDRPAGP